MEQSPRCTIWKPLFCICLFFISVLIFSWHWHYINAGDTVPNTLLPISIIEHHTLTFSDFSPAVTNNYYFRKINGQIISIYPIVPGLLDLPVFYLSSLGTADINDSRFIHNSAFITSIIVSALSVVFMYLCLEHICNKKINAFFLSLIYAFGTTLWSVTSRSLWQQGPLLLFMTISLYILFQKNPRWIPYVGFFVGLGIWNRSTTFLFALPVTIYIFQNHREAIKKYLILLAIPLICLFTYSHFYLGSAAKLGQGQLIETSKFSGNILVGFLGNFISPARGFLIFSPVLIFSFVYMLHLVFTKKIKGLFAYLVVSVGMTILLYSGWLLWWGGHEFGNRYLIEIVPTLIIFLAMAWEKVISKNVGLIILFSISLLFSVYVNFLGAIYYSCGFDTSPNDIDHSPQRLWIIKDTELLRCNAVFTRELQKLPKQDFGTIWNDNIPFISALLLFLGCYFIVTKKMPETDKLQTDNLKIQ